MGAAPVKIGGAMSTSGPFAALKVPHLLGAEMAVAEINRDGGIFYAGEHHPAMLINYDSASDFERCLANVKRLIQEDQVNFIVNVDVTSEQALAAQRLTEAAGVPILHIGLSDKLIGPHAPYTFRDVLSMRERVPILLDYLRQTAPDARRVALIDADTELGREHLAAVKEAAPRYDFTVTHAALYDPSNADYEQLVSEVLGGAPDIFDHGAGAGVAPERLIKLLRDRGYQGMIATTNDYPTAPDIAARLGAEGNAMLEGYLQFGIDDRSENYPEAMKQLRQRALDTGRVYTSGTYTLYEKVQWIKQGVEACNTTDADTFVKWLETGPVMTAYGPTRFGGAAVYGINRQLEGYYGLVAFRDGQRRQVRFGRFSFDG